MTNGDNGSALTRVILDPVARACNWDSLDKRCCGRNASYRDEVVERPVLKSDRSMASPIAL
jgi:hypothetical protein